MGWVGFEPTTNALKGHCSSTELPTQTVYCSTTSTIVSESDGICNLTNLNKKYGKIVIIDSPIRVAKNIILLTFQMRFNFLQFDDTINRHNYKSNKTHYINDNFHFVSFCTEIVLQTRLELVHLAITDFKSVVSTIPPPEDTLILYHHNYGMQEQSIQLFSFDKKIKGWYLPSLKNITRKNLSYPNLKSCSS